MEERMPVSLWKGTVQPVLDSKAEEFRQLGYSNTASEDIWKCMMKKVWKNDPAKRLYEVVQDIFHLSSNQYVSYITVEAYQNDDLMASINAVNTHSAEKE
ncbi:post-transcriptional regulator [Halobacillus sp. Marseille-Q1614]|uniref:post-transcriptional regulator n=1 Tax=Halobacillus sp. Marseille-Q1614 TaxID=2709134 RepID=UPI00156D7274|nr:post-transcriptional regulator [Halobacillus sp. Marseille-Q1614]